jgi:DNA-binding response OmpR family regulator
MGNVDEVNLIILDLDLDLAMSDLSGIDTFNRIKRMKKDTSVSISRNCCCNQ